MWMADKPLYQQKLSDNLAALVPIVWIDNRILFQSTFWETMGREWTGIDILRTDKFYLLMRRFCAAAFRDIQTRSKTALLDKVVAEYNQMWMDGPFK